LRKAYVLAAVVAAIAIGVVVGYIASTSWSHGVASPLSQSGVSLQAQACRYSFVRHFSSTLLMSYVSASINGEQMARPIAVALANGFMMPCLLSPYSFPKSAIHVAGTIGVRALNLSGSRVVILSNFTPLPLNFTIRKRGSYVEVAMSSAMPRNVISLVDVGFYSPPLVSKEIINVTMPIASFVISRVSEYSYDKDETLKTYCTYEYMPSQGSRAPRGKQCLELSRSGAILVNSSRSIGSSDLYNAIKAIPGSVTVKQINSSTIELLVNYNAKMSGFSIRAYADELIKLKDLGGATITVQCFAKKVRLSVTVGNQTYVFNVDNKLLMKGSFSTS